MWETENRQWTTTQIKLTNPDGKKSVKSPDHMKGNNSLWDLGFNEVELL